MPVVLVGAWALSFGIPRGGLCGTGRYFLLHAWFRYDRFGGHPRQRQWLGSRAPRTYNTHAQRPACTTEVHRTEYKYMNKSVLCTVPTYYSLAKHVKTPPAASPTCCRLLLLEELEQDACAPTSSRLPRGSS